MNSTSFFTNRMHLTEEGVALYVDALKLKRSSELPKEMLKHVEHCPDCQLEIVEVYDMLKNETYDVSMKHPYFDAEPAVLHMPERRYGASLYRIAAVVAGAAVLGTGYYFVSPNRSAPTPPAVVEQTMPEQNSVSPSTTKKDPAPVKREEKFLAANFEVSPNMEDLVQTQFRSISVEVLAPEINEVVQQPIMFKWEDVGEPLTLKILSNKERTLLSVPAVTTTYTAQRKFAPGLYYWKLETEDELIYVGKFLVK